MHVDAIKVYRFDLLVSSHKLSLTLALYSVVVVVFVRRRLHLLATSNCLLCLNNPSKDRIWVGVILAFFCRVEL